MKKKILFSCSKKRKLLVRFLSLPYYVSLMRIIVGIINVDFRCSWMLLDPNTTATTAMPKEKEGF